MNGMVSIHLHGDQSSVLDATDEQLRGTSTLEVPIRTLDSFLAEGAFTNPGIVKADVQGYELDVIRGAAATLARTAVVLLEVSFREIYRGLPLASQVISEMADHRFRLADVCSYAQRPRDGALVQSDLLFVKNDFWSEEDERYL
jgi:hypothetical protein